MKNTNLRKERGITLVALVITIVVLLILAAVAIVSISGDNNNTIYVICSQCPAGSVVLGQYETSTVLDKNNGVSGMDMTTEAAVTKMYYLFSKKYCTQEVIRNMSRNLRGEITAE